MSRQILILCLLLAAATLAAKKDPGTFWRAAYFASSWNLRLPLWQIARDEARNV